MILTKKGYKSKSVWTVSKSQLLLIHFVSLFTSFRLKSKSTSYSIKLTLDKIHPYSASIICHIFIESTCMIQFDFIQRSQSFFHGNLFITLIFYIFISPNTQKNGRLIRRFLTDLSFHCEKSFGGRQLHVADLFQTEIWVNTG